jgi:anaerobic magnesium-protoporphyrin IX monomethyl ester cyclase
MKLDVLLVAANSSSDRTIESIQHKKNIHVLPPLGTLYVATYLDKFCWNVGVLDAEKNLLSESETIDEIICKIKEDGFLGWTTWITTINKIGRMAGKIKLLRPDIKQFAGGPHLSAMPIKTMEIFGDVFEYGIVGEGELVTDILLKKWGQDEDLSNVPGVIFNRNGKLIFKKDIKMGYMISAKETLSSMGEEKSGEFKQDQDDVYWPMHAERVQDLDTLEIPKYEMLGDLSFYHLSDFTPPVGESQMAMITSRGCPYTCSFCDQEVSGHVWRGISPQRIIDHMLYLKKLGVDYFYLTDDLYLVNLKNVEETARLILDTPDLNDCKWEAITRINLVNRAANCNIEYNGCSMNLLSLINMAGCVQLHVAPETGNEKLRFETVFKKITNNEIVNSVIELRKSGIRTKLLNMVGLPGETPEITLETLKFIKELGDNGAAYAMVSVYTPLPSTPSALLIKSGVLGWTGDLDNWEMMNMGSPAGQFTTDMKGNINDTPTPAEILMAVCGKYKLGKYVGDNEIVNELTIENKIVECERMISELH